VPRASDPVCSLHISRKMTGLKRGPRSREPGAVTGVCRTLDVIACRRNAASLLENPRPPGRVWVSFERTARGGAMPPPRSTSRCPLAVTGRDGIMPC